MTHVFVLLLWTCILGPSISELFDMSNQLNYRSASFIQFLTFKDIHNKQYKSAKELQFRFFNFHQNLEYISQQNKLNIKSNSSLRLASNYFADKSLKELLSNYTNPSFSKKNTSNLYRNNQDNNNLNWINNFIRRNNQSYINWVDITGITNIYNQGNCGSCYVFSSADALEINYFIKFSKKLHLSRQQILNETESFGNQKCDGGLPKNVFKYSIFKGLQDKKVNL